MPTIINAAASVAKLLRKEDFISRVGGGNDWFPRLSARVSTSYNPYATQLIAIRRAIGAPILQLHLASKSVTTTLRSFLDGLIDYAGLFPPAKLSLDRALARYSQHAASAESFILGRFITPVFEVDDLAEMRAEQSVEALPLAVIARAVDHANALAQILTEDLASIHSAEEASGGAVRSDVLEIKLPGDAARPGAMNDIVEALADSNVRCFFEVPLLDGGLDAADAVISAVKASASKLDAPGIKLRCGGLVPEAFPSPAEIAHVIAACADAQVPFKATAGLHHPIRRQNPTIPTWEHGFLNVFGAAALAYTHRLAPAQIEAVIRETRLDRFTASDEQFGWADILISNDDLLSARRFATSYGSCSFDEPVADLRAAGWLQVQGSLI